MVFSGSRPYRFIVLIDRQLKVKNQKRKPGCRSSGNQEGGTESEKIKPGRQCGEKWVAGAGK